MRKSPIPTKVLQLLRKEIISATDVVVYVILERQNLSNKDVGALIGSDRRAVADAVDRLRTVGVEVQRSTKIVVPRAGTLARPSAIDIPLKGSTITSGEKKLKLKKYQKARHPRWKKFATQLAEAISTVRRVNNTSKISGWAESFRKLHEVDGAPNPEIHQTLRWYCVQIKDGDLIRANKFIPVAYSGAAFRSKFLRIQDAMERRKKQEPESQAVEHVPWPEWENLPQEEKDRLERMEEEDHKFWDLLADDDEDED